jgi:hypothetical protein
MIRFEWDPEKDKRNLRTHGVSFAEAVTVFHDLLSATFDDPEHSEGEQRFITVGMSARERLIIVAHTERANTIRIISARRATKHERKKHEG